ncbi:UNVERIFIED_CONTAM: hypothetical protein GTU68_005025, partial [Idotea baltica]|nr:hypothetical protein [Idotea baltica]
SGSGSLGVGSFGSGGGCSQGLVRHVDGSCVQPTVSRNVYLYSAPRIQYKVGPRPEIPAPKVDYNVVFVRTPEGPQAIDPIVVPPPQQKTLVYVLTKSGEIEQKVIEVPAGPSDAPEVIYVNYNDGDNPQLAGGLDLQSALASASSQQGQLIEGSSGDGLGLVSDSFGAGSEENVFGEGSVSGITGVGVSGSGGLFEEEPSKTYGAP